MTGRRVFPRRGWDPEDRPRWTLTVWFGLTSWLLGVDLERDVGEWTLMARLGPFGMSVTRCSDAKSLFALAREWWSIPIDWYGVGMTRGGFFSEWGLFGASVRPEYHEPGTALWSVGGKRVDGPSVVEQAISWRAAWDPWRKWNPPFPTMAEILSKVTFAAPRGAIQFLQPPPIGHESREWVDGPPRSIP